MINNNLDNNSTKINIINEAFSLFQKEGYSNVSVKNICDACNITRGAFYYYYKSKDDILDDIFIVPSQLTINDFNQIMKSSNYIKQFYQLHAIYLKQAFEVGPEVLGEVYKRYIDKGSRKLFEPKNFPAYEMYVQLIQKAKDAKQVRSTLSASTLAEAASYIADSLGMIWCSKNGEFDYEKEFMRIMDELFMVD